MPQFDDIVQLGNEQFNETGQLAVATTFLVTSQGSEFSQPGSAENRERNSRVRVCDFNFI
jgi:hypothetical protein